MTKKYMALPPDAEALRFVTVGLQPELANRLGAMLSGRDCLLDELINRVFEQAVDDHALWAMIDAIEQSKTLGTAPGQAKDLETRRRRMAVYAAHSQAFMSESRGTPSADWVAYFNTLPCDAALVRRFCEEAQAGHSAHQSIQSTVDPLIAFVASSRLGALMNIVAAHPDEEWARSEVPELWRPNPVVYAVAARCPLLSFDGDEGRFGLEAFCRIWADLGST